MVTVATHGQLAGSEVPPQIEQLLHQLLAGQNEILERLANMKQLTADICQQLEQMGRGDLGQQMGDLGQGINDLRLRPTQGRHELERRLYYNELRQDVIAATLRSDSAARQTNLRASRGHDPLAPIALPLPPVPFIHGPPSVPPAMTFPNPFPATLSELYQWSCQQMDVILNAYSLPILSNNVREKRETLLRYLRSGVRHQAAYIQR